MKRDKCGYDDNGTGDTAHVCGPVFLKKADMSDRILLELAAKAAGHNVEFTLDGAGDEHCWYENRFTCIPWNPLYYDADALQLAVKLGFINPGQWPNASCVIIEQLKQSGQVDWYAATRRAIVKRAAEIGSKMQ